MFYWLYVRINRFNVGESRTNKVWPIYCYFDCILCSLQIVDSWCEWNKKKILFLILKKKNIKYKRPNMAEPETNIFLFSSLNERSSRQSTVYYCILSCYYFVFFFFFRICCVLVYAFMNSNKRTKLIWFWYRCYVDCDEKVHTFNLFNSKFTFWHWQTIKNAHI